MPLVIPNSIQNDTPADAAELQANFSTIQTYVNTNLVDRDGTVGLTAPLLLPGDPTEDNHAANKAYVDAVLPVGIIMPFGGLTPPVGKWLACTGAQHSTATYPDLFAVIGYRYGGSGGLFATPNLKQRVPLGIDPDDVRFNSAVVAQQGGSYTMVVPQHNHPMPHTHEHAHTHPITHDHGSLSAPVAGTITTTIRQNSTGGTTGSLMTASATGTSSTTTANPDFNLAASVNLPSYNGNSGAAGDATTGGVSTPNTSNTGTASATHIEPFTLVTYMIRAD